MATWQDVAAVALALPETTQDELAWSVRGKIVVKERRLRPADLKALLAYSERWKPYRSAGAWYMWRAIELHKEGKLPKRAGRAPRVEQEKPKPAGAKANKK